MKALLGVPGESRRLLSALLGGSLAFLVSSYKSGTDWQCRGYLRTWHDGGIVTHCGVKVILQPCGFKSVGSVWATACGVSQCLLANPLVKGLENKIQFVSGYQSGWKRCCVLNLS